MSHDSPTHEDNLEEALYSIDRSLMQIADALKERNRFARATHLIRCASCVDSPKPVAPSSVLAAIECARQDHERDYNDKRPITDKQLADRIYRELPGGPGKTWEYQYYPASAPKCPRCGAPNPIDPPKEPTDAE